ncbi:MAG: hypothetical protein IJN29_05585 [Akkermansia sp.]|nr:hypothetical protein [Akkermansia sp.]
MARGSTEASLLVKKYAAEHHCSVQWARQMRARKTPEWVSFCAGRKVEATAPLRVAKSPKKKPSEGTGGEQSDLERAVLVKAQSWAMLQAAVEAATATAVDPIDRVALNRAVLQARKQYEDACKHERQLAIEARRWVSLADVAAIVGALGRLSEVIATWEVVLSGYLPSEMRPAFADAYEKAMPTWNEGIAALDDYIQAHLPVPC